MIRIILFVLFAAVVAPLHSQSDSGVIQYRRKTSWINIMSKMPFMTKEEIDRNQLTWGKNNNNAGEPYELHFNAIQSIYKSKPSEANYGYSWKEGDYVWIRNHKDKSMKDLQTLGDKTYLLEEDTPRIRWKIRNEIREIAGYLCMKAETFDEVKGVPVYAWFTDKIPVSVGPEGYTGLPGMILMLEMNTDDVVIEAESVSLEPQTELPIPSKMKGKKISLVEYQDKVKNYITDAIAAKRNPYWQVRY